MYCEDGAIKVIQWRTEAIENEKQKNLKISSKIRSLTPYLGENGIIRAGGRLTSDIWHHKWLQTSNNDWIVKGLSYLKIDYLMVSSENRTGHSGTGMTLNEVLVSGLSMLTQLHIL